MKAGRMLNTLQRMGGEYYSRAQLLDLLNETQNYILGSNSAFMLEPVVITTEDGVVTYDIADSELKKARTVINLYTKVPNRYTSGVSFIDASGDRFFRVQKWRVTDGDPIDGGCVLRLADDLGANVELYAAVAYWPVQLLSEDDNLTIPDAYTDVITTRFLYGPSGLYMQEYGDVDDKQYKSAYNKWMSYANRYDSDDNAVKGKWDSNQNISSLWYTII